MQADAAAYGGPGYPPAAYGPYGPPGYGSPYPGNEAAPFADMAGAVPPGFPGGTGYGPPPGQPFPGQPPVSPGYAHDPRQDPRPLAYGWYGPDGFPPHGFPPHGEARGPVGPPFPGGPGPLGPDGSDPGQVTSGPAGYVSSGYQGLGAFPGPDGFPTASAYAGPDGFPPASAYAGPDGFPPPSAYAGPTGQPGMHGAPGFADPAGYSAAGGFAGSGAHQHTAPYPEYPAWQGRGGPAGYPFPGGHGETVNGGDYAYVIHHDPGVPEPDRPQASELGQSLGEWPPGQPGRVSAHRHPGGPQRPGTAPAGPDSSTGPAESAGGAGRIRAITAGARDAEWAGTGDELRETANFARVAPESGLAPPAAPATPAATPAAAPVTADVAGQAVTVTPAQEAAPADRTAPASADGASPSDASIPGTVPDLAPELIYGPDDPAYGPPGPDWYKRGEERPAPAEEIGPRPDLADQSATRGPFEPLRSGDGEAGDHVDHGTADGGEARDGHLADESESAAPDYLPADYETPELLDFGPPTDPEAGALGEIRDLYQTAETIGTARLDRHFDQLLERQRKLISEYFSQAAGLGAAGTATPPSLGFDTAETLAGMRGELRSAQ